MQIPFGRRRIVLSLVAAPPRRIDIPEAVNVSASYGVTVLNGAAGAAQPFVQFLLSPAGQAVLSRHGFAAP